MHRHWYERLQPLQYNIVPLQLQVQLNVDVLTGKSVNLRRFAFCWLWSIVASVVVLGCSNERPGGSEAAVVEADGSPALPSNELAAYGQRMLGMYSTVTNRAIAGCMAKAGFEYQFQALEVTDADSVSADRYGPTNSADAKINGYLSRNRPAANADATLEIRTQSPAYQLVLNGSGQPIEQRELQIHDGTLGYMLYGGCSGEATIAAYGSADNYFQILMSFSRFEDFANQSTQFLVSSLEYESATKAWSTCMQVSGESRFETPLSAQAFAWPSPRPSADEVRVALLDSQCKTQTHFVETVSSIERSWQTAHIQPLDGDLERLREAYRDISTKYAAAG